jgi:putative flippase GtrA
MTSSRHREILTFLSVGGAGYVVDVLAFNWLRTLPGLAGVDPSVSKVLAVAVAMVVTYLGNRMLTWREQATAGSRRQVALFVLFNLVGLGISVLMLLLTHDVLGWTSRTADNLSANFVGLALGTAFRYWSYRSFVFAGADPAPRPPDRQAADAVSA